MIQPDSESCDHCKLRHQIHALELSSLSELVGPIPLIKLDSKSTVIRGPEALFGLGQELWTQ